MMLKDKVALIYGAGGAIGSAVARAFAPEGAELFLTGHKLAPVEMVAKDIVSAGGSAEAAEVDALDEQAVDKHLQSVIDQAGRVDISFNAVGIPDTKIVGCASGGAGSRAVLPADHGLRDVVLPDRTPCRKAHDSEEIGSDHDRHRDPLADGHAVERRLRSGAGCQGGTHSRAIRRARTTWHSRGRSSTIRHSGDKLPEGSLRRQGIGNDLGRVAGVDREQEPRATAYDARGDGNMAVLMASDKASGMTGTTVNLTMGSLDD